MANPRTFQIQEISAHPGPVPGRGARREDEVCKYIDVTTCIGCKACEVACVEWNDHPFRETTFNNTYQTMPTTEWNYYNLIKFNEHQDDNGNFQWLMRKDQCMHCADPGCLRACPADGAIVQYTNGIVDFQQENCMAAATASPAAPATSRSSTRRRRRSTSARSAPTAWAKDSNPRASRRARPAAFTSARRTTCWHSHTRERSSWYRFRASVTQASTTHSRSAARTSSTCCTTPRTRYSTAACPRTRPSRRATPSGSGSPNPPGCSWPSSASSRSSSTASQSGLKGRSPTPSSPSAPTRRKPRGVRSHEHFCRTLRRTRAARGGQARAHGRAPRRTAAPPGLHARAALAGGDLLRPLAAFGLRRLLAVALPLAHAALRRRPPDASAAPVVRPRLRHLLLLPVCQLVRADGLDGGRPALDAAHQGVHDE